MSTIRDVLVRTIIPDTSSKSSKTTYTQSTLEAHHQTKMREFTESQQEIDRLRQEINHLKSAIRGMPNSDERTQKVEQLTEKEKLLTALEKDKPRLDYFLDVGDLLFQYYDAQELVAKGQIDGKKNNIRMPANSVMSYFMEAPTAKQEQTASLPEAQLKRRKRTLASEIQTDDGLNRDKMLERYLSVIDPSAIKSGIMPGSGIEPGWGSCAICDTEMIFYQNEATLECPKCGHEEFILIDSEKPSYKDPPREITYFAYKKINHFNEWLAQFQAKENTDIPQAIIDAVKKVAYKERIHDPKKVKKEKIREILQKLKMSKMYDHVQQIKNQIQHQMTNLTLSKEMEEELQHMFKEIQPAFIKYCPPDGSNFLSYPYVLYKLCQLKELDEFLPCFQLLKSREKLYYQDKLWQKICAEKQWQFIPSI